MRRTVMMVLVAMLLLLPNLGSANPNGVGAGDFDFQCGGACHGDANMNASSTASITITGDETAYEGLFTSVTVHINNAITTPTGLLGVFLLSDLTGVEDEPADEGWSIVTNSAGTSTNYVELTLDEGVNATSVTWTLRAPSIGQHTLYAALHHGEGEGGTPFFGQSQGHTMTVAPVPERLPRLEPSFVPPSQRDLRTPTTLDVPTLNVVGISAEWRDEAGRTMTADVQAVGEDRWSVQLPASLIASTVEWRLVLSGEGPNQTTPWFQLTSLEPTFEVNEGQLYLQATALGLFSAAFVITVQRRTSDPHDDELMKELDEESLEELEVKF